MERREAAVRIVERVVFGGAYLQDALEEFVYHPVSDVLPLQEKNGAVFLSRGTVERTVLLEGVLDRLLNAGSARLKKTLHALLLTALFELSDKHTPAYAAVNAWVDLSKKLGYSYAKNLVNAVLRRYEREEESILSSLQPNEKLSFSSFLYDRMVEWYGTRKTERIGTWFLSEESKRVSVRVNESRIPVQDFRKSLADADIDCDVTGVTENTVFLSGFDALENVPGYGEGWFYPEAPAMASSVLAVADRIRNADRPLRILDACASPGGKTLQFLDVIGPASLHRILARDVSEKKVERLRENVRKFDTSERVEIGIADAAVPDPSLTGQFDVVNLDVPCSGLGVLSGKPEGKARVTKEGIESLLRIQQKILQVNSEYVRPGGVLLYSTCTLNPEENSGNVHRFLTEHSGFYLETERQFLPGEVQSDGFYFAVMNRYVRRESAACSGE